MRITVELSDELLPLSEEVVRELGSAGDAVQVEQHEADRGPAEAGLAVFDIVTAVGGDVALGLVSSAVWDGIKASIKLLAGRARGGRLHVAIVIDGDVAGTIRTTVDATGDADAVARALGALDVAALSRRAATDGGTGGPPGHQG